ncbi:acetyl-CoA carboxylase biotin carboxylase subunit family protein [Streptomyces sp. NPDC015127]|uniref:ATP-grasp domain-containing protein n=1 Tax=Streptomyces sp. NPDC015127 TaxID=3364939 RepID=UPI0036FA6CDF
MKSRVGVLLSPRGAATVRDILVAAGDDIEVVPLLRTGVREQWPGLAALTSRLFGEPVEVNERQLDVPGAPLAGVVTFADSELELAAAVGDHLGVRHRRAESADKYVQRTTLGGAGLSAMAARTLADADDLDAARTALGLPFVVKPRRGAGGTDVTVVDTADRCEALKRSWREGSSLYAEQFIPTAAPSDETWQADYVSVEVQSIAGRHDVITVFGKFPVYTRGRKGGGHGQVATTGDILPCRLPADLRQQVEQLVIGAHHALGMDDGVTHTEVKLGSDGPEIIEINCRVGGHLSRLLKRHSGFDLVRQALLITAGLPAQPLPSRAEGRSVAGMFVPFASAEGDVLSRVSPAHLKAAGAATVDEIAREGAPRTDTDAIACNVVLDCADADELRRTTVEFLGHVREMFAKDGVGDQDWTADMITLLGGEPARTPAAAGE